MPTFYISINDCSEEKIIHFNGTEGIIRGFTDTDNFTSKFTVCFFKITVPEGLYIMAYSQIVTNDSSPCKFGTYMAANGIFDWSRRYTHGDWTCNFRSPDAIKSQLLLIPKNVIFVKVGLKGKEMIPSDFWLHFESTTQNLRESFKIVHHSRSSGYITVHGFDQGLLNAVGLKHSYTLHLPRSRVVMLSFPHFQLGLGSQNYLEIYSVLPSKARKRLWKKQGGRDVQVNIYNTSLHFKFSSHSKAKRRGFKCVYSFLPLTEAPEMFPNGMFNCSAHYETFRHHVDCNLRVECQHQEDETDSCPFSSKICKGAVHLQVSAIFHTEIVENVYRSTCA